MKKTIILIIILFGLFSCNYGENNNECLINPVCPDSKVVTLTQEESEKLRKEQEKILEEKRKQENMSEEERIKIDEYNFEQLEKVKTILDPLDRNSYSFNNLKEFNEKFSQNIKPIKNCYFLSDRNWFNQFSTDKKFDGGYIFAFELYSETYKIEFGENYFSYPKYDLPTLSLPHDEDVIMSDFNRTITNHCQD